MTGTGVPAEEADAIWRGWMTGLLSASAEHFGLTVAGSLAWGWRDRSVGAATAGADGPRWLRVVTEDIRWAHGDWWTGNSDANVINGITKPVVLSTSEWEEGPRRIRADVMTLVPGHPCSTTDILTAGLDLPAQWWLDLRRSLDAVTATRTSRECVNPGQLADRVRRFGAATDLSTVGWETAHGDLHWANLFQPRFAIIDWEWWGRGPVGLDAATLYCYSLLMPGTAQRVHDTFHDVLNSPQGAMAQLYACARLLSRAERGDHPELAPLLRRHGEQLARALAR
jgi:hypothetical protein